MVGQIFKDKRRQNSENNVILSNDLSHLLTKPISVHTIYIVQNFKKKQYLLYMQNI